MYDMSYILIMELRVLCQSKYRYMQKLKKKNVGLGNLIFVPNIVFERDRIISICL